MSDNQSCLFGCLIAILAICAGVAVSAGFGWLTMTILAAFGVHMNFWISWGIWILAAALFGWGKQ